MRFTGSDSDINIDTKHPEFDAWRWVAARDLAQLIVPFKRAIYLAVFDEFSAFLPR
jgi:putative (di)nucleoside polyphosphate hydrolase